MKKHLELGKKITKKLPALGPISDGSHICMVGDELHKMSSKGLKTLRQKNMLIKKEAVWACSPKLLFEASYYDWEE